MFETSELPFIIITVAITVAITAGVFIAVATVVLPIPSEESCNVFNTQSSYRFEQPNNLWCEKNETGWHFNRTAFREDLETNVLT